MNTPYGLRGELQGYPWKDIVEEFEKDGIKIKVTNGVMDVGYGSKENEEKARKIAQAYINAQSLRSGRKITVDFNHTWKPNASGNTDHGLSFNETVTVNERVLVQTTTHQASITGKAYIVNQQIHDSASFTNDSDMVDKALKDEVLDKALGYFSEEVVDNDRPLYGIYKAIEIIIKHLGKDGRKMLASLAGEHEKYVSDLMETTNTKRHAISDARKLLEENECKGRAKILIEAYVKSI